MFSYFIAKTKHQFVHKHSIMIFRNFNDIFDIILPETVF
jgi:hypothetical protein